MCESESEVAQSCPTLAAHQAPPSMGFSRQEYWSGVLFPSPGDLPDPGIKPRSPTLEADALTSEPQGKHNYHNGKQSQNSTLAEVLWPKYFGRRLLWCLLIKYHVPRYEIDGK